MTRRVAFTKADVARAVRAVKEAGEPVARVEFDRDGKFAVVPGRPEGAPEAVNEWDAIK